MNRLFVTLFVLIAQYCISHANYLSLYSIDNSNYPNMSASFYLINHDGMPIDSIDYDNLHLYENDTLQTINSIYCPKMLEPVQFSTVFAIDISTSMGNEKLDYCKNAISQWLDLMPRNNSTCGIISFNHDAYLISGLSNNIINIKHSLNYIFPWGSTHFRPAFFDANNGAFKMLNNSNLQNKSVVLFTDGGTYGFEDEIISKALELNIKIHVVYFGTRQPKALENLAIQTGGMFFGNVSNAVQAKEVCRTLLMLSSDISPCTINWTSSSCSIETELTLFGSSAISPAKTHYSKEFLAIPTLNISDFHINFGEKSDGFGSIEKQISIRAVADSILISEIFSTNSFFAVSDFGGTPPPFALRKDSARIITLSFSPPDTLYYVADLHIDASYCNYHTVKLSGGTPDSLSSDINLLIARPKGGERLAINSVEQIKWQGISPSDSILIEFKSDHQKWDTIALNAGGMQYDWNVPDLVGNKYLLRLSHFTRQDDYSKVNLICKEDAPVDAIGISRDGKIAIAANEKLIVRNLTNGSLIRIVSENENNVESIGWDINSSYVSRINGSPSIFADNYLYENDSRIFNVDGFGISDARWSNNGNFLAAVSNGGTFSMWNFSESKLVSSFSPYDMAISALDVTADASHAAIASIEGKVMLFDAYRSTPVMLIDIFNSKVKTLSFNQTNQYLIVGTENKSFEIWNINFGDMFFKRSNLPGSVDKARFSNNNKHFAILSGGFLIVYEIFPSVEIYRYRPNTDVNDFVWSYDGNFIFAGLDNGEVHSIKINDLPYKPRLLQSDTSSSYWSIVAPDFKVNPLHFGKITIGEKKDTLLLQHITNKALIDFPIDSITISGADAGLFNIVHYKNTTIAPNEALSIEISVLAEVLGKKSANLNVYSKGRIFSSTIGIDILPPVVKLITDNIYFGSINIGDSISKNTAILKNISSSIVVIDSVRITGMAGSSFFVDKYKNKAITPNDSIIAKILFVPRDFGAKIAFLEVYINHPASPLRVVLNAEALAPEVSFPHKLELITATCFNEPIDTTFYIQNIGNGYLNIESIEFVPNIEGLTYNIHSKYADANDSIGIDISYYNKNFANDSIEIHIHTNIDKYNNSNHTQKMVVISDTGSINLSNDLIVFNPLVEFSPDSLTIEIYNNSAFPQYINLPAASYYFEIAEMHPNPIPPFSAASLHCIFKGGSKSRVYQNSFKISDHCGKAVELKMNAWVGAGTPGFLSKDVLIFDADRCDNMPVLRLLKIYNNGTAPLIIHDVDIIGSGKELFEFVSLLDNVIPQNDSIEIFIYFYTEMKSSDNATLQIKTNIDNENSGIFGINLVPNYTFYDFSFTRDTIDFGVLRENIPAVQTLNIHNIGSYPMTWFYPINKGYFEIKSISPIETLPGSSSQISVKFNGAKSGNVLSDYIDFTDSCNTIYRLYLKAEVSGIADALLEIDSISAKSGEIVDIPIRIKRIDQSLAEGIREIRTKLRFNSSLLYPIAPTPLGTIRNGFREIEISLMPSSSNSSYEFLLPMMSMTGDSVATLIYLSDSYAIADFPIIIEEKNGLFHLAATGNTPRLISSTGVSFISQAYPNPSNQFTNIDFGIIEKGTHSLSIYNLQGVELIKLFEDEMLPGKYTYTIDLSAIARGTYLISLVTPSGKLTEKIIIL